MDKTLNRRKHAMFHGFIIPADILDGQVIQFVPRETHVFALGNAVYPLKHCTVHCQNCFKLTKKLPI